jgi:hypothetical protein
MRLLWLEVGRLEELVHLGVVAARVPGDVVAFEGIEGGVAP